MVKVYSRLEDYLSGVTLSSSQSLGWQSVRAWVAAEPSNELSFPCIVHNTIKVTLSGTRRQTMSLAGLSDGRPAKPGEAMLIPAGSACEIAFEALDAAEQSIFVEFDADIFQNYSPEVVSERFLAGHLQPAIHASRPEVVSIVRLLARELNAQTRCGKLFAETAIRLLAIEIANSCWTRFPSAFIGAGRRDPRVNSAIRLIEQRFAEDISLIDLKEATGLSTGRLIGLFKEQTLQTPYAYLLGRRIEHAVALLCSTDRSIASVAVESGFGDQQHMTRIFQKRLGQTPRSIRMSSRQIGAT